MVLSPDYLNSLYTQPEWSAAFAQDPTGEKGILLPVRVGPCKLEGMLSQVIYIDLVELKEDNARQALLNGIERRRLKPASAPAFPTSGMRAVENLPKFPGTYRTINFLKYSTVLIVILILLSGIFWYFYVIKKDKSSTAASANIEATVIYCNSEILKIAFSNTGRIDGIISNITTNLFIDAKQVETNYSVRPENSSPQFILSPGESKKIVNYKAYIGETETIFFAQNDRNSVYSLKIIINWNDSNHTNEEIILKCECQR